MPERQARVVTVSGDTAEVVTEGDWRRGVGWFRSWMSHVSRCFMVFWFVYWGISVVLRLVGPFGVSQKSPLLHSWTLITTPKVLTKDLHFGIDCFV